MKHIVKNILEEYILQVERACDFLIQGINKIEKTDMEDKRDFFGYLQKSKKTSFFVDGIEYQLHGKGCHMTGKGRYLDWDFGYRSRWCGIDPWKVAMCLKQNNSTFVDYFDGNLILNECEQAVKDGIMYKQNGQYYFKFLDNEVFEPDFPKEFDTLLIEHADKKWYIPRNKLIDKFIRKSKKVYSKVGEERKFFILKFLKNGKEVYSIPYDDIGYPENAIRIMSDIILKEFQNGY